MAGLMTASGACLPAGNEPGSNHLPAPALSPSASSQVSPSASPSASNDPTRGWVRVRVGEPLRNPDNHRPTINNDNKAYILGGMTYLCPTAPSAVRAAAGSAVANLGGQWAVSLTQCQQMPEAADEPANIRYLQTDRQMAHPYTVVTGEPITRPYTPDAGDDKTLPWVIRPHEDTSRNIYLIERGSEDVRLYCPRIPEIRFTGTVEFERNHRRYTVRNYSIGTDICVNRGGVVRSRVVAEMNRRIDEENRRIDAEDRRRVEEDEQNIVTREGISIQVSGNIVLYGVVLLLNFLLFRLIRKERT